ncbi:hypothetical protein B566_EDAN014610, partial [Ephemera danica]
MIRLYCMIREKFSIKMFKIFVISGIFLSILFQQIYTDDDYDYQFNLFEPYSAGGKPANITDYPYQASLQYSFYGHVCGGAIISEEWILTAARCVSKFPADKLTVVVGTTALDNKAATKLKVQEVKIHEEFENSYLPDYDIAAIRVNLMTLGETIAKIQLPNQDYKPILPLPCTFSGWGAKEVGGDIPWDLQSLPQTTLDFALCRASFKNSTDGALILQNSTLCTMNIPPWAEDIGPCLGEWGSPLVCSGIVPPTGSRLLLGLLSGDPLFCGRMAAPNLFTQ